MRKPKDLGTLRSGVRRKCGAPHDRGKIAGGPEKRLGEGVGGTKLSVRDRTDRIDTGQFSIKGYGHYCRKKIEKQAESGKKDKAKIERKKKRGRRREGSTSGERTSSWHSSVTGHGDNRK